MPILEIGRRFNVNKMKYGIGLLGVKDGVNVVFDTPDHFIPHTICLFLNGQRLTQNEDYVGSYSGGGTTYYDRITILSAEYAPQPGDLLVADYMVY